MTGIIHNFNENTIIIKRCEFLKFSCRVFCTLLREEPPQKEFIQSRADTFTAFVQIACKS